MELNFLIINVKMKRLWRGQFQRSDKVLDVGCGDTPSYHEYIPSTVICTDKSPSKAAHLLSDAQSLPMRDSSFDGLVSVNALYYCEKPRNALKEFSRALKKNGKIVLVTPFFYPIHDMPYDKYRFTESGLREVLKEDFFVDRVVPVGGIFSIPALLLHSFQKGASSLFPKNIRPIADVIITIVLLPLTIVGQLIGLLDVFDRSKRFPIYYFTVARKK